MKVSPQGQEREGGRESEVERERERKRERNGEPIIGRWGIAVTAACGEKQPSWNENSIWCFLTDTVCSFKQQPFIKTVGGFCCVSRCVLA